MTWCAATGTRSSSSPTLCSFRLPTEPTKPTRQVLREERIGRFHSRGDVVGDAERRLPRAGAADHGSASGVICVRADDPGIMRGRANQSNRAVPSSSAPRLTTRYVIVPLERAPNESDSECRHDAIDRQWAGSRFGYVQQTLCECADALRPCSRHRLLLPKMSGLVLSSGGPPIRVPGVERLDGVAAQETA